MDYHQENTKHHMLQCSFGKLPFPMCFMFFLLRSSGNQTSCHTLESDCANVASKWLSECRHCIQNLITAKKTPNQPNKKPTTQIPDFYHSILDPVKSQDCFPTEKTGTHIKNPSQYILVKTEVNFDICPWPWHWILSLTSIAYCFLHPVSYLLNVKHTFKGATLTLMGF